MTTGVGTISRVETKSTRTTRNTDMLVVSKDWKCIKRNGKDVSFDVEKIKGAVSRCFTSVGIPSEDSTVYLDRIVRGVLSWCKQKGTERFSVEDIQRFIVAQLFAEGLFEAAEHYQNYREAHRKLRLSRPIAPEVQQRFDQLKSAFPTDLQAYQMMSKFSRWKEKEKRRETWTEVTHERVMPWFKKLLHTRGLDLTPAEWERLATGMYRLEVSPAMRVVQMAGPALDRCNVGVYNCAAAPVIDIQSFPEALYILMQGTGFGFSVEEKFISNLPRIHKWRNAEPVTVVVEDTTEGWCDAYRQVLDLLWDGRDFFADVTKVRPKGAKLKTKGGRASGPGPLLELFSFARNMFKARSGKYLEDTDVHRLMCFTGRIVQVGGVRRAATISLSDLSSAGMQRIKIGAWYEDKTYWIDGKYLTMANNSAVYEETPPMHQFVDEWAALMHSYSGERGIFNRQAVRNARPARREDCEDFITNPCAEINLRPHEFCNLSIVVARPDDTEESLLRKVELATYFGVMQSLATNFKYIRPEWKINCEKERLLGVDITGHADCPLLRFNTPDRDKLLQKFRERSLEIARELSTRFGIEMPAAVTTVKPSGDSSVFFDSAAGVSPRFAKYQIRWVRESKESPVAKFLIDSGVPYAPAPEAPEELLVFGFPKKAPEGATVVEDMTAIQQLENWLVWKENYVEHSVSATIYIDDNEWMEAGAWVYKNFDKITGLSFLPRDNGSYTYAPNEKITEAKYNELMSVFPDLNWAKLTHYEDSDNTESSQTFACVNGQCSF